MLTYKGGVVLKMFRYGGEEAQRIFATLLDISADLASANGTTLPCDRDLVGSMPTPVSYVDEGGLYQHAYLLHLLR